MAAGDKSFDWDETAILDDASALARFMNCIDIPHANSRKACWLWKEDKSVDDDDYGKFSMQIYNPNTDKMKCVFMRAPRVMYAIVNKKAAIGKLTLHSCPGGDNPRCCSPHHIRKGTHKDNAQDALERGGYQNMRHGDQHPNSKITEEQALEIIRLAAEGHSGNKIRTIMNLDVGIEAINAVANGSRWKHLGKRVTKTDMVNARYNKIIKMRLKGKSFAYIAKKMGFCKKYVADICSPKRGLLDDARKSAA